MASDSVRPNTSVGQVAFCLGEFSGGCRIVEQNQRSETGHTSCSHSFNNEEPSPPWDAVSAIKACGNSTCGHAAESPRKNPSAQKADEPLRSRVPHGQLVTYVFEANEYNSLLLFP